MSPRHHGGQLGHALTPAQRRAIISRWQAAAEWVTRMNAKVNQVPTGPHWAGAVRRLAEDEAAKADHTGRLPRHILHKSSRDTHAARRRQKGRAA